MGLTEYCVLGIDFNNDFTQVAYQTESMEEPESICVKEKPDEFLIPTAICKWKTEERWQIGEDAYESAEDRVTVDGLVRLIEEENEITIDEKSYGYQIFVQKFFESLIKMVQMQIERPVDAIQVTSDSTEKIVIDTIMQCFFALGYQKEQIRVFGHSESFIHYIIGQPKELWMNDVVLFDFREEKFMFRRLSLIRDKDKPIVEVVEEDLTEVIDYSMLSLESGRMKADSLLLQMLQSEFKRHIVSTAYLTGTGFYDEWAVRSMPYICNRRRVFLGQNLFVKGACIAAKNWYRKEEIEYLFSCPGVTKINIGLLIEHEGKNMQLLLSKAGSNWYEAGAQTECILDNIQKIQFVISSPIDKISKNYEVDLSEFPVRPNKTTRVKITLAYQSDKVCMILVQDKGFGDFFKASGITIKKLVRLEEYIIERHGIK